MSSVDERVVEMRFDNQQFERGASTSISTLGKLQNALKLGDSAKSLDTLGTSVKGIDTSLLSNGLTAITSKFSLLGTIGDQVVRRLTDGFMNLGGAAINAVKSLTIGQIKPGFEKYTSKTEAVQTIMNATGKTIEDVNVVLDKLNTYTDETSYSFSDMVNSIGKFTGAGVELERAENAMEGIANWAASAGVGPEKAASAFYNLSQAVSAGYLKMQDWKSLQNLNMSTKQFKETAIETALQMEVLKDKGKGVITTAKGMEVNYKNFDQTLASGWLTSEVLLQTLEKYADQTTDFGLKAYHAAQEAKTFKDAIGAVKDAVSTGWAQTWELVFGNYEEAKVLWTNVANEMIDFFGQGAEARNEMLKTWHDTGGYTAALEALDNAWTGIKNVTNTVKEAFRDVFPPMTAERLVGFTEKIRDATARFKDFTTVLSKGEIVQELGTNIGRVIKPVEYLENELKSPTFKSNVFKNLIDGFKGLFSGLSLAGKGIKAFIKSLSPAGGVLKDFGLKAIEAFGKFGRFLTKLNESGDATEFLNKVSQKLFDAQNKVIDVIGKAKDKFSNFGGTLKDVGSKIRDFVGKSLSKLKDGFTNIFKDFDLKDGLGIAGGIGAVIAAFGIKDLVDKIKAPFESLGDIAESINNILSSIGDSFKAFSKSIATNTIIKIAVAIGLLAGSLLLLGSIKVENLTQGLLGITILLGELYGMMALLSKNNMLLNGAKSLRTTSSAMLKMAAAVLVLAAALKMVSSIESGALFNSITAIGALIAALTLSSVLLSKYSGKAKASAAGMVGMAAAVLVLAFAVKQLAAIDSGFNQGLLGTIALLTVLTAAGIAMSRLGGKLTGVALGMIGMAAGLLILTEAVKKLGAIDLASLGKGVGSIAALLAVIALFNNFGGSAGSMIAAGVSLLAVSAALVVMTSAVKTLGELDLASLGKGVGSIGALLLLLGLFNNLGGSALSMIGMAAGMLVMAVAISAFVPALLAMGSAVDVAASGIFVLAGIFVVLGAAGALLTPVIVPILALSAALLIISASIAIAGAGFVLLAAGLSALSGSVAVAVTAIITAVEMLITGLASIAVSLVSSIAAIISAIAMGFAEAVPAVVSAVLMLILGILNALVQNIPAIATAGIQLITGLINAIASQIGPLVDAGVNLIVSFIVGMAEAIDNHADDILNAIGMLIGSIIAFVGEALARLVDLIPGVGPKMGNAIRDLTGTIKSELSGSGLDQAGADAVSSMAEGAESAAGDMTDAGTELGGSLVEGVESTEGDANAVGKEMSTETVMGYLGGLADAGDAGTQLGNEAGSGFSGIDFESIGSNGGLGLVQGLLGQVGAARDAGAELGGAAAEGARGALQVQSPSRVFMRIGKFVGEGFCIGINHMLSDVSNSTETIGTVAVESMSDSMKEMSALINSDTNVNPVITPVLDLSAIKDGRNAINSYLSGSIPVGIRGNIMPNANEAANIAELIAIGHAIISEIQNGSDLYFDDGAFAGRINRRLGAKI